MAVELNDGSAVVKLEIYMRSIQRGEHKDLRRAAEEAEENSKITWLADAAGNVIAAVVPAEFAARALQVVPLA